MTFKTSINQHNTEGFFIACFKKIKLFKYIGSNKYNYPYPNFNLTRLTLGKNNFILKKKM